MWWWASLIRFPVTLHAKEHFTHVLELLMSCAKLLSSLKHFTSVFPASPVIFIRLKIMCPTTTGKMLELWLLKFSATFSLLLFLCGNCWSFIKNFQGKIEFNSCIKIIIYIQTKIKNSWETSVFGRKVPEIIESHLLVVF